MRLVIVTKSGVPVARNILIEVLRRSQEGGGKTLEAAFVELETEFDAYAKQLVTAPEYGELAPETT